MAEKDTSKTKIITINERDPNYTNTFVTDAFTENTPNESTIRLTFYEEYGVRPDALISELDEEGRIVEGTTESIFNSVVQLQEQDFDNRNISFVKRTEKATLVMSKESLSRLKDWLNDYFK